MTEEPVVQITVRNPTSGGGSASLVYILYLTSFVLGITLVIGVVIAYLNQREAPDWVKTHYRFQIRTFWIGLLYGAIGVVSIPIFVGILVLIAAAVWLIVRCVKGMKLVSQSTPHPNPATWWF